MTSPAGLLHPKDDERIRSAIECIDNILRSGGGDPMLAIDTIDRICYGRAKIRKANLDLTTIEGFISWVIELALLLRAEDSKAVASLSDQLRAAMEVNWPELTEVEIGDALDDVRILADRVSARVIAGQAPVLLGQGAEIVRHAKDDVVAAHGLGIVPTFSARDLRQEAYLANSTVNFIRDNLGRINDEYSSRARRIVEEGLAEGLGRNDIARALESTFGNMRPSSYYDMVAGQYVNRARSWGFLTSFQEAAITAYVISAVLDERTCFVAGTPVRMADGTERPIEKVRIGDSIRSISGQARPVVGNLRADAKHMVRLTLKDGRFIVGTWGHPVLTPSGWIRLGELRQGDKVASPRVSFPEFVDRSDLSALRQNVSSPENLRGTRVREPLLSGVSQRREAQRDSDFKTTSGMRAVREGIPHQARGVGKESASLLERVRKGLLQNVRVCSLRESRYQETPTHDDKHVLFDSLLPAFPASHGTRATNGNPSSIGGVEFREASPDWEMDRRFSGVRLSCNRSRWGILALASSCGGARSHQGCGPAGTGLPRLSRSFEENRIERYDPRALPILPHLLAGSDEWEDVANVEHFSGLTPVYDLSIAEEPGYIASGIIVHNTDTCRYLDGMVFSVESSLALLEGLEGDDDPGAVRETNPWITNAKDDKGSFLTARQPDGKSIQVARVDQTGVGTLGRGTYSNGMNPTDLQASGIGPPPYHAFCRTTLVPEIIT